MEEAPRITLALIILDTIGVLSKETFVSSVGKSA